MKYVRCITINQLEGSANYMKNYPLTVDKCYELIDAGIQSYCVRNDNGHLCDYLKKRFVKCNNELNINIKIL